MPAEVRAVHEFVFAAYPELVGQALELQIRNESGEWLVSVADASASGTPGTAQVLPVMLRARVAFDRAGGVDRYSADGPFLNDAANVLLKQAAREHPAWTDGDADAELMRLGGTGAVGRAFVPANFATAAFARQLGGNPSATPARFTVRDANARPGAEMKAAFALDVTSTGSDGKPVQYQLTYEPFGGRLVGMTKVGGAK